jgi:hypothetical protein
MAAQARQLGAGQRVMDSVGAVIMAARDEQPIRAELCLKRVGFASEFEDIDPRRQVRHRLGCGEKDGRLALGAAPVPVSRTPAAAPS